MQHALRMADGGGDLFGGGGNWKRRLGPEYEGLTVIIFHAIFYFIIGPVQQVSVLIEQNIETMALEEMTWLLSRF